MRTRKAIVQKHYSLREALGSIPCKDIELVRTEVMEILDITSKAQWNRITKGACPPTLAKARAVEVYFQKTWGVENAWKEVTENNIER